MNAKKKCDVCGLRKDVVTRRERTVVTGRVRTKQIIYQVCSSCVEKGK